MCASTIFGYQRQKIPGDGARGGGYSTGNAGALFVPREDPSVQHRKLHLVPAAKYSQKTKGKKPTTFVH